MCLVAFVPAPFCYFIIFFKSGVVYMNLADSKLKLLLAGAGCGVVAAILAFMGNPANMAFCIACFIRDMAGSLV